jgi:hypothetical protein
MPCCSNEWGTTRFVGIPQGQTLRYPRNLHGGSVRTGSAGFQPASRAGGSMPPVRDLQWSFRAAAGGDRPTVVTPSTRHRAASTASRLKAGAPSEPRRLSTRRDTDATSAQPTRMLAGRTKCLVCRTFCSGSRAAAEAGCIFRGRSSGVRADPPTDAPDLSLGLDGPANLAGSPIDAPCRGSDKPARSGSTVSENKGATGRRRIQIAPNLK